MHGPEKSDRAEVLMNQPNKGEQSSMEAGEKKGANQGEHRSVPHKPDTERGTSVPRIERCAASSNREGAGTICSTLSLSICSATAAAISIDNYFLPGTPSWRPLSVPHLRNCDFSPADRRGSIGWR